MTKPHGTDVAGRPVDLIGQPLHAGRGSVPSITIRKDSTMAKAEANGTYTINGRTFVIRKGDELPKGAEFTAEQPADLEARALKGAPENRAEGAAPENRSKRTSKKADDE